MGHASQDLGVAIPKLRRGSFIPSNPEATPAVEQARVAVVQEAYVDDGLYPRGRPALRAPGFARHEQGPHSPPCGTTSTRDPRLRRRRARDGELPARILAVATR